MLGDIRVFQLINGLGEDSAYIDGDVSLPDYHRGFVGQIEL